MSGTWTLRSLRRLTALGTEVLKMAIGMPLLRWMTAPFRYTICRTDLYRIVRYRILYPRLGIAYNATCHINGEFEWGKSTAIGERSVLVIPVGSRLLLGNECYIGRYCELGAGSRMEIGDKTSIQDRTVILGNVRIGRYCLFSYNIYLSSGHHHFRDLPHELIHDQDSVARQIPAPDCPADEIVIEDDCWIGINVVIRAGVHVGKGCVVGANAVVTRDLPPYSIAAGVPARIIGNRLDFRPPREISYDKNEDLPYFYRGFRISSKERETARSHNGIISLERFAVALDPKGATEIHLLARSLTGETITLVHGRAERSVGNEVRTNSYRIAEQDGLMEFVVKSNRPDAGVIVERAWVT